MNFQDYIKTELLILVPVLYFIGIGLKKSKLPDKWIPLALGFCAISMSTIWLIATTNVSGIQEAASAIFTAVTQGIFVAGASVYAHLLCVQTKISANSDEVLLDEVVLLNNCL